MADIFLDLDGTLTDPKPGITGAIAAAMAALKLPCPDAEELTWAIGPPLIDTFAKLGAPDPDKALDEYRRVYTDQGLFDATVYPGILDALDTLNSQGHRMFLMTAKPHAYAKKITAHFGLDKHLSLQFGPELDGTRNDKAELLRYALGVIETPKNGVMIGDRIHDLKAASANHMPFVAAQWGYGTHQELINADYFCEKPADLPQLIAKLPF